ncbi:hypothetical protein [Nocardia sp. NPDC048505]|uniref:hypothetical protein n=1 Tax=unclassified Nocardia TaxID=2637762 RepID=UPI0033D26C69
MSIGYETVVGEIHDQHEDLARWLGTADAVGALERFVAQLHPDFSMVTVDGVLVPRSGLLVGLSGAGHSLPGLMIDITDVEVLADTAESVVARFREVHHTPAGPAARWTTALLLPDPAARNALSWRSVHETVAAS